MTTFFRWLGRALFALLVVALLACVWTAWNFQKWKSAKVAALDAGSRVVDTAAGPVEYTELGSGPAVLVCHGAPGGYDQAALIGESLAKSGFRVIAPSRPGFLRTPLTTGLFPDEQADALANLLDKLGIARAAVIGFSTGAQVAAQFALRHPDRTTALVLLAPITKPYDHRPDDKPPRLLPDAALSAITGDMGAWLFVNQSTRDPGWLLDKAFTMDTSLDEKQRAKLDKYVLRDPAQLAFFRNLVGTLAPMSPRESGTRNDLLFARVLEPIAYEKIQAPTLIVHGGADAAAKWDDIKEITSHLPAAKVITVRDAGQLVWFGPDAGPAQQAVAGFLKNPPTAPPAPLPEEN